MFIVVQCFPEAVVAQGRSSVYATVVGSFPTRRNEIFNILIYMHWKRGIARRKNSAESGQR